MSNPRNTLFTLALAALLLALPLVTPAGAQEPAKEEAAAAGDGVTVKKVHRVVLAPDGEKRVRVITAPGEHAEVGELDRGVNVLVVTGDGEGEGGEPHPFVWRGTRKDGGEFVWTDENGETVEGTGPFIQRVPRGFLGVELTELTPDLRAHFGAHRDRGVLVAHVVEDSPALRAGLRVGDVLTHVDGEPVTSSYDVTTRVGPRAAGEVVALEVLRDHKVETLSATVEVRERPQIEVGRLLHRLGGEGEGWSYAFDTGELEKSMEEMRLHFASPEWKQQMETLGEDLRKQLEDLEIEIDGLEKRLDVRVDVREEEGGDGE
jgi:membrane-associated protease RseP (regulator of RpoE activity)